MKDKTPLTPAERMKRSRAKKRGEVVENVLKTDAISERNRGYKRLKIDQTLKQDKCDNNPQKTKPHFIAVDGEGVNSADKNFYFTNSEDVEILSEYQAYVLLCASSGEHLHIDRGISTQDALTWLCDLGASHVGATFIIFGGGYDINMWMRDLAFKDLLWLRTYTNMTAEERHNNRDKKPTTPIYKINDKNILFELEWLPRKEFKCIRYEVYIKNGKWDYCRDSKGKKINTGTFHMYDTMGFFQCKFVKALEQYNLLPSDSEFLCNMKDARGQFEKYPIETIIQYCKLECTLLVKLLEKIDFYLNHPEIDLQLKRWDGAGSIASAMLKKYEVKNHIEQLPEQVLKPALHAFSGGRIELVQYGHIEGDDCVYDYDINSAYPHIMAGLPSLRGGQWIHSKNEIASKFALIHIKWDLKGQRIFPFFYRDQFGTIIYPKIGEGWYWLPEYEAYLLNKDKYKGDVQVLEVWNFFPVNDEKPFAFIPPMAKQRLLWKQAKEGQHVVVKLGLNSCYGKTAQQIGGGYNPKTKETTLPPYHNIAWAGYITSATRAKLFDAAMQDPHSVVMFATDGLFTTKKRDLPLSSNLGEWELSTVKSFTACQAGVYWFDNGKVSMQKSRGFEAGSITEEMTLSGWLNRLTQLEGVSKKFITFGMIATAQHDDTIENNMKRLCGWEKRERLLALSPKNTKRQTDPKMKNKKPYIQLVPTVPADNHTYLMYGSISHPYKYKFDLNRLNEADKEYMREIEELAEVQSEED
jgi:hypothetical protein